MQSSWQGWFSPQTSIQLRNNQSFSVKLSTLEGDDSGGMLVWSKWRSESIKPQLGVVMGCNIRTTLQSNGVFSRGAQSLTCQPYWFWPLFWHLHCCLKCHFYWGLRILSKENLQEINKEVPWAHKMIVWIHPFWMQWNQQFSQGIYITRNPPWGRKKWKWMNREKT